VAASHLAKDAVRKRKTSVSKRASERRIHELPTA